MRYGRLGTIDWADRLAILTLDACQVQTLPPLITPGTPHRDRAITNLADKK